MKVSTKRPSRGPSRASSSRLKSVVLPVPATASTSTSRSGRTSSLHDDHGAGRREVIAVATKQRAKPCGTVIRTI